MAESGQLVRGKNGRYVKGTSGNPAGRPQGSKNVITVQKLMLEEAFRDATENDMGKVLALIVKQALTGDKAAQKLVWDACVSKQNFGEDKTAGSKAEIKVTTKSVVIEGEFNVETSPEGSQEPTPIEETLQ